MNGAAKMRRLIDGVSERALRQFMFTIADEWYIDNDGTFNRDKQVDSDSLQCVTQALNDAEVIPDE